MSQINAPKLPKPFCQITQYFYTGLFLIVSLFFLTQLVNREISNARVASDFVFFYSLISTATLVLCLTTCAIYQHRLLLLPALSLVIIAVSFFVGIDVLYMLMFFLANPVCISFLFVTGLYAIQNKYRQETTIQVTEPRNHTLYILLISLTLLSEKFGLLTVATILFIIYVKILVVIVQDKKNKLLPFVYLTAFISIWVIGSKIEADQTEILACAFLLHITLYLLFSYQSKRPLILSSMVEAGLWAGGAIWFSFIGLLLFALYKEIPLFSMLSILVILIGFYLIWRTNISAIIVLIAFIIIFIFEISPTPSLFYVDTDNQRETILSSNIIIPQIVNEAPLYKWIQLNEEKISPIKEHDSSVQLPDQKLYLFFGSDTHGRDSDNQVRRFNLETLAWNQDQPASPSWLVARSFKSGLYVPGLDKASIRPIAMHSYDQLAWLNEESCMALLGVAFHHLPTLWLPERRQLARLWCYDPAKYQWKVLSDPISSPRLFSGTLVESNDNKLYALGHHNSMQGLLPIGKEHQASRSGLFRWSSKQPVWYPVNSSLETGSQIVGEWDSATANIITFDDGGRSVRIIDPGSGKAIHIARNENCIQRSTYPPITATSSTPGRIHFIVRKGKYSALCVVNLYNKQIEFLHHVSMSLPMNFHLHYIKDWESLLIFQSSPDRLNERTAWFMRI